MGVQIYNLLKQINNLFWQITNLFKQNINNLFEQIINPVTPVYEGTVSGSGIVEKLVMTFVFGLKYCNNVLLLFLLLISLYYCYCYIIVCIV